MALDVAMSPADGQQRYLCVTIRLPFRELAQNVLDADGSGPDPRSGGGTMHGCQGIGVPRGIGTSRALGTARSRGVGS